MRLGISNPLFRARVRALGALSFSLCIFAAGRARAQDVSAAPPPFTFGNGECPEPAAVEREVRRLIPSERQSVLEQGVRIELLDLGESYRVSVSKDGATVKKSYADAARDCDGRARFAAVFAVLTIMPPELEANENPPPPIEPPPPLAPIFVPAPRSAPHVLSPPLARIELSGAFVGAPAFERTPRVATGGGLLGLALGRGALAGTLSFGYFARTHFELAGVDARLVILPASAGVRYGVNFGAFEVSGELGVLALLERIDATNLARSNDDSALELGARVGVLVARPIGPRFRPFFGVFSWVIPAPHTLRALPQGELGTLPHEWVGGTLGVSFGL